MKIAVVDDGVDNTHSFLAPTGMSYPPGFPKGGKRWTSPKVIVARAFRGPAPDARAACRSSATPRFTARMSPGSPRGGRGPTARRGRPSPGRQPLGRRSPTPGSATTACSTSRRGSAHREHAGDRGRVRGGGSRRDGRHQLLGRRHGDRPGERRDDRDGSQRIRGRRRAGDLCRQLARRLRVRQHRLARDGA